MAWNFASPKIILAVLTFLLLVFNVFYSYSRQIDKQYREDIEGTVYTPIQDDPFNNDLTKLKRDVIAEGLCELAPSGLMQLKGPLKIYTYGPIPIMAEHARLARRPCSNGMFGMQVRIPDYFAHNYTHRVASPEEAHLILFGVYGKCASDVIMKRDGLQFGDVKDAMFAWTLGNWTQEYKHVAERLRRRDWVWTFPSGAGATIWRPWRTELPNSIFLGTEASNWKSPERPYFLPHKDVIIPGHFTPLHMGTDKERRRGEVLVLYCGDFMKSVQRRKVGELSILAASHPRVRILRKCVMSEMVHVSRFCLVPQGWTPWTVRFYEAVLSDCVPVVFGAGFIFPFPDLIDYASFVVRWPVDAINGSLVEHLERMPDRRYKAMLHSLRLNKRKLLYDAAAHPNAYDHIVQYLHHKYCTWTLQPP